METPTYTNVKEKSFTADHEFRAEGGKRFTGNVGGDGILQYWDGSQYVAYDDSGPGFNFYTPATGKLKLVVTSGTVVFSMTRAREMN